MLTRQELESHFQAGENPLYNFALRCTWNPALAQELVQEAFLIAWQRREKVLLPTLRGLLYAIVLNLARNGRRRARLLEAIPLLDWVIGGIAITPDQNFLEREGQHGVRLAIEALPEELRETLLLCQFSELTQEEIATSLGIAAGTVASRKSRALALLRENLSGEEKL